MSEGRRNFEYVPKKFLKGASCLGKTAALIASKRVRIMQLGPHIKLRTVKLPNYTSDRSVTVIPSVVVMSSSSDLEMCDLSNSALHAVFLNATSDGNDSETSFAVFEANHHAACDQEWTPVI